ncbi:gamma-aminobutyric acid receptor subunit gamma-2 [Elysia marginata]|uniref:Gamma-aminobutyric acid receptor subunit gamma-2 n=1 Tax=Elysia marginata TaxID=1093978 RepID=A0AAV4JM29_9GAST|nr:gamma-aminobutyric acid receptor subunit gamma-2 [Elysia marginata]
MKIGEIDTVKEKFDADVFIQARWREPALDSHHPMKAEVNWSEMWNPGINIQNLLQTTYDKTWRVMEFTSIGEVFVVEKRRVKGTFSESMELEDFPFDTQHLSVVLTAEESEVELVEDAREPSLVSHLSFVDEQEWLIRDLVECVPWNKDSHDLGSILPSGNMLVVRVHATRRGGFFFWNVLVIMCLICSLIFCTFSVTRNHPTNRLQLSFTVVLTTIAFKFVTNQHLPKVSYLTVLDKYILSSIVLMHLVSVWHACICLASDNTTTDTLDIVAFVVFLVGFLLLQLIFLIYVRRNEKLNRLLGAGYTDRIHEEAKRRAIQRKFLPDATVGAI